MKKKQSETLCKNCGKETYNESSDWVGFCSKECQDDYID